MPVARQASLDEEAREVWDIKKAQLRARDAARAAETAPKRRRVEETAPTLAAVPAAPTSNASNSSPAPCALMARWLAGGKA